MSEKIQLNKTSIKGLYLTIDGKAWRNDLKIEIKPTTNGKIRFNGKLYDLQKIIKRTSQKPQKTIISKQKPPVKKTVSIRELQKQGFKKTQISGLYLTNNGLCYNSVSKRFLTITNGKTTINGKAYNVAKIILETFCKIPVRSGQINFINGNDKDFSFENLEYKTTINQPPPVPTDLIKCIRFYFEVDKNFTTSNILYKYYLYQIILKRGFEWRFASCKDFDLFLDYSKNDFKTSNNQNDTFAKFNYTATNGKNAINKYLNLLINECLQDFENGLLHLKNFAPKPQTKTQKLKELQKSVNEYGLNVKIPLRKKSIKELLNNYKKNTKAIDFKIETLKNEPPQ
ncbi:hypothetical protein DK150_370078 [Flavobacterium psychrophilum]|uniref:hypothetical protein n=1 Tax=Flavobacterium psychrophilum TaxID=96345 RepID=UPI000B7C0BBD|nr:hypothetical protein [Flavobacterium psychrophilum]SNA76292.1 hypothetical protein DK150_370078 [Flavobacterium psychrophilum]